MILKRVCLIILFLSLLPVVSCEKESPSGTSRVVIGLSSDIESFNPLFAFNVDEGSISELLYLSLVNFKWDSEKGDINPLPMLATKWEWNRDSSSITLDLRNDVLWSDSIQFTADDIVFSFDVYSDPNVQSKLYGTFEKFYTDDVNHIDINKTFEVINPFKLKINFLPHSNPSLFDVSYSYIPKHIFEKISRKNFSTAEESFNPVTNGPFLLSRWDKNQSIVLKANEKSFLYNPGNISELIFKIVPDYNSRLTQLKRGEIDLTELIKTEDITALKEFDNLKIVPQKGREYDYIGWNNIDPEVYGKSERFVPNRLFGSPNVRKALTYAINRKEILEEYLSNYGELAVGPISPIFTESVDPDLEPYDYDVAKAKELLAAEGWSDPDKDGIIEKGNKEFRFTLFIPGGNPRRSYAATVIKNNLKEIGIEVNVETVELNVLIDNMYDKNMDAWMVGWYVIIPIELKSSWYSDQEKAPYNFANYQNPKVDSLLDKIEIETSKGKLDELYKDLQEVLHNDEPVTFLYWIDNLVGYNSRIKNIDINPLGVVHYCWEWRAEE
jgi:peptide/nickel transport system substrate-binding protein